MNAHWILQLRKPEDKEEFSNASFHCSNCHIIPMNIDGFYPLYERYCHNCGAHMIEEPTVEIDNYKYDDSYRWEE